MLSFKKITSAIEDKGLKHWLLPYFSQSLNRREKPNKDEPVHIMLSVVDHFEPFFGGVDRKTAENRVKQWVERYPVFAGKYQDADGKMPQHTWFYPPHLDHCFLKDLVGLCKQGYGEIEMHLHHNHMEPFPDTSETLRQKILKCIEDYSKYGIFCLPDGSKRFAFIHGDWSLDNSRGPEICGINDEIRILKECGCYADFTFPSLGEAQPAIINKIYYVEDDPSKPKSYNKGRELFAGGKPWGDLLMIPGILGLRWKSRTHRFRPSIEASNIDESDYPFPERIDYWIKNAVRIEGRPDWLFIKLHTHGVREETWDSVLGEKADQMYSYLGRKYNDGERYVLHYVTAREMYNIIKSVEAREESEPNRCRNYFLEKYCYA